MATMPTYDVVVVGGGVAGLSAATWLGRYRRHTLLVDSGEYRNARVESSHGYLGRDGVSPAELLDDARRDLGRYELIERRGGKVRSVTGSKGDFIVDVDGDEVLAHRVVLATGVGDACPDIEGFFDHYGASAFHCPTCDGFEACGRNVVVVGWSEAVSGFALRLLDWAKSVTVLTDGHRFEGDDVCLAAMNRHGMELVEDVALTLEGTRGDLQAVVLRSGRRLPAELLFFTIAHIQHTDLAEQLGCRIDSDGHVEVDETCETSVPGVYAAGDLTPGMQLLQVGAAKGTIAGVSAAMSLQGEEGSPVSPTPAPDPEAELQTPG
jgi:thioredoxin reductase